jgi:hypothetical protein
MSYSNLKVQICILKKDHQDNPCLNLGFLQEDDIETITSIGFDKIRSKKEFHIVYLTQWSIDFDKWIDRNIKNLIISEHFGVDRTCFQCQHKDDIPKVLSSLKRKLGLSYEYDKECCTIVPQII